MKDSIRTEEKSFIEILEHLKIADALDGFIASERVRRWGFLEVERFTGEYGFRFEREHGNLYGKLCSSRSSPLPLSPSSA